MAYIFFFLLHLSDGTSITNVAVGFLIITIVTDLLQRHMECTYKTIDKTLGPIEMIVLSFIMLILQILFLSFLWEFAEIKLYGYTTACVGDLCLAIKIASNITVFIMQGLFFKRVKVPPDT